MLDEGWFHSPSLLQVLTKCNCGLKMHNITTVSYIHDHYSDYYFWVKTS